MSRAQREPEIAKLFMTIQDELGNGRSLLDEEQSAVIDRACVDYSLDIPTAPEWLRPAIASSYLLAKDHLTQRVVATITSDPEQALRRTLTDTPLR